MSCTHPYASVHHEGEDSILSGEYERFFTWCEACNRVLTETPEPIPYHWPSEVKNLAKKLRPGIEIESPPPPPKPGTTAYGWHALAKRQFDELLDSSSSFYDMLKRKR